jgi:ABC-2 type transport system permease protein
VNGVNLRGGWSLIKGTWMSWLQQRSFFFLLAFGWMIPPLISLFVWYSAASTQAIDGLTQNDFVTYYLLFILVNQLTYSQTNWTVGDAIRSGAMNALLLRPLSPLFHTVASEVAGKVVYMTFVIPVVTVLALIFHPALHPSLYQVFAFMLALIFAWLLRFFWGYWLALLAFWATQANALLGIQDALIFLLAGQVAPIALLPGPLVVLAQLLPFRYMISFPIEILLGQLNATAILTCFAYQIGWLLATLVIFTGVWRNGVRHYTAVGG